MALEKRKIVFELPEFDTGQYENQKFTMEDGNASLTIYVTELPPITFEFKRLRWHQFISYYLCDAEWFDGAYFRLIEITASASLDKFVKTDPSPPYKELHHYRIFTEGGGHEFFSESVSMNTA